MRRHPIHLVGWLLAATVMLSLVGLTARPLPVAKADPIQVHEPAPQSLTNQQASGIFDLG